MRVLYVTQEMDPYTSLTEISQIFKSIPKYVHEKGFELRVLMPKYGVINERRHRLHEVVRLSGMNIIVDDEDYPLIIKVASIPQVRLQVYFLDNEEFFKRKNLFVDDEGKPFQDNVERMVFFSKGVMEIVRKFGWAPDIVHCHGPITGLIPLFVKRLYRNDPIFSDTKVIYSVYTDIISSSFDNRFWEIAAINNLEMDDIRVYGEADLIDINFGAMKYSDGIIIANNNESEKAEKIAREMNIPVLPYAQDEEHLAGIVSFYRENFAV